MWPIRVRETCLPQFGLTAGIDNAPSTQPQFIPWEKIIHGTGTPRMISRQYRQMTGAASSSRVVQVRYFCKEDHDVAVRCLQVRGDMHRIRISHLLCDAQFRLSGRELHGEFQGFMS